MSDEPARLSALPGEVVVLILVNTEIYDLGAAACVCREFGALVESALRIRAKERGSPQGDVLPPGETSWAALLSWRERRDLHSRLALVVAAGARHSVFADAEGRLLTCGEDVHGRGLLGQGEDADETVPQPAPVPSLAIAERVVAVAAHSLHTLALTVGGAVYSFGYGACGQLGHGDGATQRLPRRVEALNGIVAVSVAAGQQHSLVLARDGQLFSFGSGFGGKLGHGDQHNRLLPVPLGALADVPIAAIAAGTSHSLAAARDGALYSWGNGAMGQLGHGSRQEELSPRRVDALAEGAVVAVAAGEHHSLAVDDAGACYSFGAGEAPRRAGEWLGGWLGHGDLDERRLPTRLAALAGVRVVAVAAGTHHSLALTDGGQVVSWGAGEGGKLGHGDARFQWVPKRIHALERRRPAPRAPLTPAAPIVAVAAGAFHSLAVDRDGRVWSWGSGAIGLGPHRLTEHASPLTEHASGSAGNYDWDPSDRMLAWQAHFPMEVLLA